VPREGALFGVARGVVAVLQRDGIDCRRGRDQRERE
jgi:hypothetical protein